MTDFRFVPGSCRTEVVSPDGHVFDAETGAYVRFEPADAERAYAPHKAKQGETMAPAGGSHPANAKLTDEDVAGIRRLAEYQYITQIEIAQIYEVSQPTISRILAGKHYPGS